MNSSINLTNTATVTLSEALMIYRAEGGGLSYATHHPVKDGQLGPAQPLTRDFVRDLANSLQRGMKLEILPENVLARTPDVMAWWTPAQRRPMFFTGDRLENFAHLSGKTYPHPPLVWIARAGRTLHLRALAQDERPTADTPMFIAPYWNVNGQQGWVCTGSMEHPETESIEAIPVWERGFWRSKFSHPNATKIVDHAEGYLNLLSTLIGDSFFPFGKLIPAKQTLAQFLQGGRD